MESPFTLEEVQLLEESASVNYDLTSRKQNDLDRMPNLSPAVRQELNSSKTILSDKLDKLALLRAKIIQLRISMNTPAEPAIDQTGQSSE